MAKALRAAAVTAVLVLVTFSALLSLSPSAAAASKVWTTDTDFNEPGAVFIATEVIGTGVAAKVELVKSVTDWANKNPPSPTPGGLEGASMAYDEVGGVLVLFGGYTGGIPSYSDKTWEYSLSANAWTEITSTPKPPMRQSAGMSYDPVQQVIVLFGGFNDGGFLADTWEYDVQTNTWAQVSPPTSPPPLVDAGLAYHASASRHIVIGQSLVDGTMQTWAYDAAANTWTNRNPSGTPSPRSGFGIAYHAGRDRTVLFGGSQLLTLFDETWEYNYASNSWSQVSVTGPSARAGHSMTYRPATNSVLLFGGLTGSGKAQDTWRYFTGPGGPTWEAVSTTNRPSARNYAAFAFDRANDAGVLYGGSDVGGGRLADTWALGAGYASSGRYTSAPFDSGGFSNWIDIWWNKTTQPPSTFLRFQIRTSNDGVNWNSFKGPACTVSSYYTTPGAAICAQDDGRRWLQFLADFGSTDTQATPSMEDVTINYAIIPAPPCIIATDPPNITFDVPVWKNITVRFSEPMDPASVSWRVIRGYLHPTNFTGVWTSGNSVLTLYHYPPQHSVAWDLGENQVYQIQIYGKDVDGNSLSNLCPDGSAGAPNPFTFVTWKINPRITKTTPPHDYGLTGPGYGVTRPIYVEFSEGMNTSTVAWNVVPNVPGNFTAVWTAGDTNLTLNHATPLAECEQYTVQIWGKDKANLDLIPGPVPNPWTFYTFCSSPFIILQDPRADQLDVAVDAPIVVDFSEPMLTTSVSWDVVVVRPPGTPPAFSPMWTNGNRRLTLTHAQAYLTCRVYQVTVSGTDVDGNPLVPNPRDPTIKNPWKFMTQCDGPSIVRTVPADGETNVAVTQPILIAFSDPMNEGSVTVSVTGGPFTEVNRIWSASVMLEVQHIGFRQCTRYTVWVTGTDQSGRPLVPGLVPNPWSFDIVCTAPYVVDTNPANNSFLVPVTQRIWVNFSEPMDTANTIITTTPLVPGGFTPTWSNGDRTVRWDHPTAFAECTTYTAFVDGMDKQGENLLTGVGAPGAPNPWVFTTRCPGFYVATTDPAHLQQNVPRDKSIVITFSEGVDIATFQFTLPPFAGSFTQTWTSGDSVVTLSHGTLFDECRIHTATVSARSKAGQDLVNVTGSAPNPWTFRTACVPPQILSTSPADGATNVPLGAPIVVTFSEAMMRSSVSWTVTPTVPGGFTPSWTLGDTVLTLNHATAFSPSTQYCVLIQGTDLDGNPLVPGPVPNPWCFTTGTGPGAPGGLQVIRQFPNDVLLTWRAVTGASSYVVYHSIDKFAAWPWAQLAEVTTTSYLHGNALGDGLTHCYIVRAKFGALEGTNSSMGCKVPLSFTFSTTRSNTYWISLPYRSMYRTAKDISDELTSTRIDVVGKWNPATQSPILWYYFRGAWRGTNFPISPGDGIYIGVRSSFQWVLNGTDGAVPRTFTLYPPPNANVNWISLPLTSVYRRASDVVVDIEGGLGGNANTKIIEVAKWDGVTQTLIVFQWNPGGWGGTDFPINPGEGIYLRVVSTFTWVPRLITPEVP